MLNEIETLSFVEIARRDMATSQQLPTSIRDALNTIFTKPSNAQHYRKKIICQKSPGEKQNKHPIIKGRRHCVRNILIIWYLLGGNTKKTKCFLQDYAQKKTFEETLTELVDLTTKQYLEFFCFGVVRDKVQAVIECLKSPEFDLFTQKLPTPFSVSSESSSDIYPILQIHSQDIPWEYYMQQYQLAEKHVEERTFEQAKNILSDLEAEAIIRLPIVEALNRKIAAEEIEAKEAWDYFQKILN